MKWWRVGATRRQHDPDWSLAGNITIYDNRMSRDYSQIVSIDPVSYHTAVEFDGRSNGFYSRVRGKHQFTENGSLLITSDQEGRFFEVNSDGEVVLEIVSTVPGNKDSNYSINHAIWLPPDTFSFSRESNSCTN